MAKCSAGTPSVFLCSGTLTCTPLVSAEFGVLEDSFTFLGIFLAIVLFPLWVHLLFRLEEAKMPQLWANFT